jgi:hypothetical protein
MKINSTTKMSYRDWRKHGYQVRKGEKAKHRLAGEVLFTRAQVDPLGVRDHDSDRNWEEMLDDFGLFHE